MQLEMPLSLTYLALGKGSYRKVLDEFLREAIPFLKSR
jgi:hypothetical protein